MAKIHFGNQSYAAAPGESLLDTLLANHCRVPWSCRAGLCHSCLMQATLGEVPSEASPGLSQDQINSGFFLACQCFPTNDITVRLPERHLQPQPALITERTLPFCHITRHAAGSQDAPELSARATYSNLAQSNQ